MPADRELLEQIGLELFDNAPCGYLATLADGAIVQVNQTFINMTGYDRAWLLGGVRFAELLSIAGRIYHDTHFGPLLQMQGFVKEVAFELLRRDQHRLPVLVNAKQSPATATRPALTLITIFDATDRRQYEHELLLAQRRAEQAADAERTARQLAETAARAKDEFLAMVSHELRTPLNAILGWTQILKQDGSISEDQRDGLAIVERNAQMQATLIGDLLDMSRIVAGKMRLDVQEVTLAGVIEAAIDTARPAAEAKGLRVQKVLDPTVIVSGDAGRLQQVFWNLLINAVKFTPKGGFVRAVMQRVNSHVEVRVIDSGQGMSRDFVDRAFERFSQSHSGETRKTPGLGLGLSIAKNLVEMHGGSIHAMSDGPGLGSTFLVNIPVAIVHQPADAGDRVHPSAAVATTSPAMRGISLQGVKVLVVEDEADARDILRRVLTAAGAQVISAASAAEALELLDRDRADVLVSDIGMPDVDGYELIRRVRMMGQGAAGIRAVALTAFTRLEDRTRAMLAGYQMHLAKPVDARELIVTVATLARK